ncbi:MAG TPA: hypothetical protein VIX90_03545 [Edaphobacter sp.]
MQSQGVEILSLRVETAAVVEELRDTTLFEAGIDGWVARRNFELKAESRRGLGVGPVVLNEHEATGIGEALLVDGGDSGAADDCL